MKAAIAYEFLCFLKVSIFEDLIIFERLTLQISIELANITFKHFAKCCFTLWFCKVIKTMGKGKEDDKEKNRRKAKQNYHNDVYRWKRNSFLSKADTKRGIV